MNIGLSITAGNTADTLPVFFKWAIEHFTEINVVVQPNNFDDTLDIIKEWERKHSDVINVKINEFDNFSNQAQRAIDMCSKDWCIILDSDEILGDFPYNEIPTFMSRVNKRVGILPRYNLQKDINHYHTIGYPDYQACIIKMNEGIKFNGKVVDESLEFKQSDSIVIDAVPIIHFGHIRPSHSLLQKGKDRIKFANEDPCDGPSLKKYGIEWFSFRNNLFNKELSKMPRHHILWIRKYVKDTYFEELV